MVNQVVTTTPTSALPALMARRFIERSDGLRLKGKKRDDAALEFFMGAWTAAVELGNDKEAHALSMAAFLISVRGWSAVKEYASRPTQAEASAVVEGHHVGG